MATGMINRDDEKKMKGNILTSFFLMGNKFSDMKREEDRGTWVSEGCIQKC